MSEASGKIFKLYDICQLLKFTSGRNEKIQILKNNKDDEDFIILLKFLFDKNITTGIDAKKLEKKLPIQQIQWDDAYKSLNGILQYITANNTGRDIDVMQVQRFIDILAYECDRDDKGEACEQFLKDIITKSLTLGIDAKTINKAIGAGTISTFDVQLGTPIEKCKIEEGQWFSLSRKLNGTRCIYYNGKFYTRNGKEYIGLDHIKNDLQHTVSDHWVIDGELILKDRSLSDSESFQISTGIANSNAESKEELKLVIFDFIAKGEFDRGEGTIPYSHRKATLQVLQEQIKKKNLENIEVVEFIYDGRDQNKIWEYLDIAEANDWEGLMLNTDDFYRCKRVKSLIKIKKFFDIDLKVIGIAEGTGRNRGKLGAVICDYKDNIVSVGSGFTDEQREFFWNNKDKMMHKIITVKYKEATQNKQGTESLQFPVFVCVREDKDKADA